MKKFLFVLAGVLLLTGLLVKAPVLADGVINWAGNGKENLPCSGGAHWVLAPSDGITGATLHVNGSDYTMSQSGNNGSWSADSSGPLEYLGLSASVSFTGEGSNNNHLQLSHCIEGETPTDTPTPTETISPTPTDMPTETPTDPTATPTNTPSGPTVTPTNTPSGPTATPKVTEVVKEAPVTGAGGLPITPQTASLFGSVISFVAALAYPSKKKK